MERADYIETREDIISNIKTLYSYIHGDSGEDYKLWAIEKLRLGRNMVIEIINGHVCFGPSRFVGYLSNTKEKHDVNHGDGKDTDKRIKQFYQKVADDRLDAGRGVWVVRSTQGVATLALGYAQPWAFSPPHSPFNHSSSEGRILHSTLNIPHYKPLSACEKIRVDPLRRRRIKNQAAGRGARVNDPCKDPSVRIGDIRVFWAHPTNPVEGCADANPKTMLPNDT